MRGAPTAPRESGGGTPEPLAANKTRSWQAPGNERERAGRRRESDAAAELGAAADARDPRTPFPRTDRARLVHPNVLSGHVSSLPPY